MHGVSGGCPGGGLTTPQPGSLAVFLLPPNDLAAAPQPSAAPTNPSWLTGLVAWYAPSSYNSATRAWSSQVSGGASVVVPAGVPLVTDAVGSASNTVPINYLSGSPADKVIFPETYGALTAMSICAVGRYTSTSARYRIFQPYKSQANWLHGAPAPPPRGAARLRSAPKEEHAGGSAAVRRRLLRT